MYIDKNIIYFLIYYTIKKKFFEKDRLLMMNNF